MWNCTNTIPKILLREGGSAQATQECCSCTCRSSPRAEALGVAVEGLRPARRCRVHASSFPSHLCPSWFSSISTAHLMQLFNCRFLIHPGGTYRRVGVRDKRVTREEPREQLQRVSLRSFGVLTRTCKHISCHVRSLIFSTLFSSLTFMYYGFNLSW